MERAQESDVARPPGGEPGELHRALDGLRTRIGEENPGRSARENPVLQPLGELDFRRVVEVGAGHMEEALRLLLYRGHDSRMGVAGGDHGDPGGEVEKPVAVDVGDPAAASALHDKRV